MISSDFYAVYQSAGKKADGLVNLYCWAHIRRYFVPGRRRDPAQLGYWTARVAGADQEPLRGARAAHDRLGGGRRARRRGKPPRRRPGWSEAGAVWDEAIGAIDEARKKQMTAPGLQEPAKKALATLDREWDGLIAHRDYPMIGAGQ